MENFLQAGDRQPSPILHAAIIGAADGFFFLGILGLIIGAVMGRIGLPADRASLPILMVSALLFGGAIFFGSMAYALTYRSAEFLYSVTGGVICSVIVARLFGSVYSPVGIVAGMAVGKYVCRAVRGAYSPKFQPPRIGKTIPRPPSVGNTDITRLPPSRTDANLFRKGEEI